MKLFSNKTCLSYWIISKHNINKQKKILFKFIEKNKYQHINIVNRWARRLNKLAFWILSAGSSVSVLKSTALMFIIILCWSQEHFFGEWSSWWMSETPSTDPFPTRKSVFLLPFDMFINLEIQEIALTSQKFISEGNISLLKWHRSSELMIHETSKTIILLESYYFYPLCPVSLFFFTLVLPSHLLAGWLSRCCVGQPSLIAMCGLDPDADTGETLLIQKPFRLGARGKNHKVLCLEEKNRENLKTNSFAKEAPLLGTRDQDHWQLRRERGNTH